MSLALVFSSCVKISNPEKSGGEIIAVPKGHSCSFNISGDGKWMQYIGDESPHLKPDEKTTFSNVKHFYQILKPAKIFSPNLIPTFKTVL